MRSSQETLRFPCPAEPVWIDLAAGALPCGAESDQLLLHAAECSQCSAAFRKAVEALRGDEHPPEEVLAGLDVRIPEFSARMSGEGMRRPRRSMLMIGAGVAAAVAIGVFFDWQQQHTKNPLVLLAKAYETRRNIELRIPGARFSEIRRERAVFQVEEPAEMIEALSIVQRGLAAHPDDPAWLHAKGRVELLRLLFDEAAKTFQAAREKGANSAEFWVDFGTAYFGQAERQQAPADYARALQMLDTALSKDPGSDVALFNRGVVHTRLRMPDLAALDFEKFLKVARDDGGWRADAERRLAEIRTGTR